MRLSLSCVAAFVRYVQEQLNIDPMDPAYSEFAKIFQAFQVSFTEKGHRLLLTAMHDNNNNNNNSIYLYSAISPELKFCSEALVTTLAWLSKKFS